MGVFVLDRRKRPLMPCSEKRARLLLARGRAVVHRLAPFTIRLKDRPVEASACQPVVLKVDPGSRTTGLALAREQVTEEGPVHHALHLAHLAHRGTEVHAALVKRAAYRRRRRSANLRYRAPRWANRRRKPGWLPPSLVSRVGNVLTWARRYQRLAHLSRIEVERVRFDTQLLQNPAIAGLEYQQGTLAGWEVRAYLLEKWQRRCAYCGVTNQALEVEHIVPKSRGGSDRISNLALACHACNQAKGNQTAAEFGHAAIQAQARQPLADAAAMNATRSALVERLRALGLPVTGWSGGLTRWNRERFGLPKTHALDALCVGDVAGVDPGGGRTLLIEAVGRGQYQRTNVDGAGFPRGYRMRQKRVHGFQTGDLVRAEVPAPLKTAGRHVGPVAVRVSGFFRVGRVDGIGWRYCRQVQRADGYAYQLVEKGGGADLSGEPRVLRAAAR
jgi:5-methylcytosine-specific restriction endonuclease McrA